MSAFVKQLLTVDSAHSELTQRSTHGLIGWEVVMDELLQRALDRRRQLREELAAVDKFVESYSAVQERRNAKPETDDLFPDSVAVGPKPRALHSAAVSAAMDAAARLIVEAGRPLTRGELVTKLSSEGHQLDGADKNKVLGTNLWRSGKFVNLKGAGYWPKSEPLPNQLDTES
jgi:hypothetical protein